MNNARRKTWFGRAAFAAAWAILLWVCWIAVYALIGNDWLFPSFSATVREAVRLLGEKFFWKAFAATFLRTLAAFSLSFFPAAILAVVAYTVPAFGRFFAPVISAVRSLPTMAVLLIILVWTTPKTAPVIVAFLALFPLLYAGISAALSSVDPALVEMSRVYRVPLSARVFRLYLPSAAPYVLRESSAALSFALKLTVSAEVLANTYVSLGGLMQQSRIYVEMPALFALTLLVVSGGFALEGIGGAVARFAERRTA